MVEPRQPVESDRIGPVLPKLGGESAAGAAEIQARGSDRPALEEIPSGKARFMFAHASASFCEPAS